MNLDPLDDSGFKMESRECFQNNLDLPVSRSKDWNRGIKNRQCRKGFERGSLDLVCEYFGTFQRPPQGDSDDKLPLQHGPPNSGLVNSAK